MSCRALNRQPWLIVLCPALDRWPWRRRAVASPLRRLEHALMPYLCTSFFLFLLVNRLPTPPAGLLHTWRLEAAEAHF